MEPARITDEALHPILEELKAREPIFHRPEFGLTRQDFERMTDASFWEVGASGRRYSREYVLDLLEQRHKVPVKEKWEAQDFYCQEIAINNYLLTYTLKLNGRITRRSTIWRRTPGGWRIVYHQGTVVEG